VAKKLCYCTLSQISPLPGRRYLSSLSTARREYSWAVRSRAPVAVVILPVVTRRPVVRKFVGELPGAAVKDGHEGTKSPSSLRVRGWAREGENFLARIETYVNLDDAAGYEKTSRTLWIVNSERVDYSSRATVFNFQTPTLVEKSGLRCLRNTKQCVVPFARRHSAVRRGTKKGTRRWVQLCFVSDCVNALESARASRRMHWISTRCVPALPCENRCETATKYPLCGTRLYYEQSRWNIYKSQRWNVCF